MFKVLTAVVKTGLVLQSSAVLAADSSLPDQVNTHYANLAHIIYSDSLNTALALQASIDAFIANPDEQTQQAAKDNWKIARVHYGQSEAIRFGKPKLDEWEGQVNDWQLAEGLIDYVNTTCTNMKKATSSVRLILLPSPMKLIRTCTRST